MATKKKMLQAAAGQAGGAALDITDVFSTYLYTGTGAAQTITNGIDLDGEGGLLWIKKRSGSANHYLSTNETGGGWLYSNQTNGIVSSGNTTTFEFQSNGFINAATGTNTNGSGEDYVSWTFRKAPKFFTCLTYSGTGSAQNISHDLGSVPGMIIVKQTDATNNWMVQHRAFGGSHRLQLNSTDAAGTTSSVWNNTDPTSTVFTVGANTGTNASGGTYVAYVFAHNDGDGGFGPDGDQDIIKCGSYTGNGSTDGPEIDLGFEPQWVMIKASSRTSRWWQWDNMRGLTVDSTAGTPYLRLNTSDAEAGTANYLNPQSTGFKIRTTLSELNESGQTYIYMAIRRGPLAQPESGTDVFNIDVRDDTDAPMYKSGFVTDFSLYRDKVAGDDWRAQSRLTGKGTLFPNTTDSESSIYNETTWDFMNGFHDAGSVNTGYLSWMWKRAPGYFDAVAYTGNSTAGRTVSHNLGVAPEMMWVKRRDSADNWTVYHSALGNDKWIPLNQTAAALDNSNGTRWYLTTPTDSLFTLGVEASVNGSGGTYIAYLFATLPGISKVGSYSGNNSSQTIDCGFTTGARFVLIKASSRSGSWAVWDSARGITAGDDPRLELNSTSAEQSQSNIDVEPHSSGFIIDSTSGEFNEAGETYIFYAIA